MWPSTSNVKGLDFDKSCGFKYNVFKNCQISLFFHREKW